MSTLNPDSGHAVLPSPEAHPGERREKAPPAAAAVDPTDDRVLALRPIDTTTRRLPNQHDLLNVDDDELFNRQMFEDDAWVEDEGARSP
jgi:hypothetical protein